jgi:DNA polymerase III alpha subunit
LYINCHTYYSLRYGTLSPKDLVANAKNNQAEALVLTDINNSTGMPDFVKECNKAGIKPIGGIEFRDIHHVLLYIGIAINNEGFRELNDFLTLAQPEQNTPTSLSPGFFRMYWLFTLSATNYRGVLKPTNL